MVSLGENPIQLPDEALSLETSFDRRLCGLLLVVTSVGGDESVVGQAMKGVAYLST
jgi:hypothetical protein